MIYIAFLLFTFLLLVFVFYQWQYFMVFAPTYYREGKFGDEYEILSITTSDGIELEGVVYEPVDAKSTLLFFGGQKHDSVGLIDRLASTYKDCRIITFNYRSYGRSEGSVNEKNILNDAIEIAEKVQKNYGYFYVLGFSIGGSVASYLASRHKTLGLFLVGVFDSIPSLIKEKYGVVPSWMSRYRFDNIKLVQNIDAPTYLFASQRDEVTYIQNARKLKNGVKNLVLYKELENIRHGELLWDENVVCKINEVIS